MKMLAVKSRNESGIIRFDVLQDAENQMTYNMYMVFRDPEAITKHRNTEHFQKFIEFKDLDNALFSQNS